MKTVESIEAHFQHGIKRYICLTIMLYRIMGYKITVLKRKVRIQCYATIARYKLGIVRNEVRIMRCKPAILTFLASLNPTVLTFLTIVYFAVLTSLLTIELVS